MPIIKTAHDASNRQPILTFGYCQVCSAPESTPHKECRQIKETAESFGLTVREQVIDGWYFASVRCGSTPMLTLARRLAALELAKETSLEIPSEKAATAFSKVAGLGEVIFTHKGRTYIATGQPKGHRPRISRGA